MAQALPGICGLRGGNRCKIAHTSRYANGVGVYPDQFLPSRFTIWRAVFASQFSPASQLPFESDVETVGGILGLPGVLDVFIPTLPETHTFQSHHTIIFAQTANRLNIAHTLTQAEIDSIGKDGRSAEIGVIDVGEYIFEAVAVTDQTQTITTELTEEDVNNIKGTGEAESDRAFRKLFEQDIPDSRNRLTGIELNRLGIEYRLDNGTEKSRAGLDQAGIGDMNSASYRDGSSKKLEVDLLKITERLPLSDTDPQPTAGSLQAESRVPKAGDTIYLTYVAIKKHYLRQRVNISWQVFDGGSTLECYSLPLGYSIVHYRFYEWLMEPEDNENEQRVLLSGWRAVESFSSDINFIAMIKQDNSSVLADFPIGGTETLGLHTYEYIPGKLSVSQLKHFINNRSEIPDYIIPLTELTENGVYHINAGINGNSFIYNDADWYKRNQVVSFDNRLEASNHVFFNVHPTALRKRDVDKWGIERTLAEQVKLDIDAGKTTFVPFMDDPDVNDPTVTSLVYLDGSNTLFEPIEPVTSYGGNFEAVCGSLGTFPASPAPGINSYHAFESNRITEKFDKETRILVERNFAVDADILQPRLITIEGVGGIIGGVSCIADPSFEFSFTSHINQDSLSVFNTFQNGQILYALKRLSFRPDLAIQSVTDYVATTPFQFEKLLGASSNIGDASGCQPGRVLSVSAYLNSDDFIYKATSIDFARKTFSNASLDNFQELNFTQSNVLSVLVGDGYYGSFVLDYEFTNETNEKSDDCVLVFKTGGVISSFIDGLTLPNKTININTQWLKADTIELIGERVVDLSVKNIAIRGLNENREHDFLEEHNSHGGIKFSDRMTDRSIFFETNVVSITEDESSRLFVFFNDKDDGISAISSLDFGSKWHYHYGVVEKIDEIAARDPFLVTSFSSNCCFLFYRFSGKILCKKIPFSLFNLTDGNLIERFYEDILIEGTPTKENNSNYSLNGSLLRRNLLNHVAAGDLTDNDFLQYLGKNTSSFEYNVFEEREINGEIKKVRKYNIARGPHTAFANRDITDSFFSAYRNDTGNLRLFFMSETIASGNAEKGEGGGGNQLQCHFSLDDGQNWYDYWEFIAYGFNRLKYDSTKKSQFIDRTNNDNVDAIDPLQGNQQALFGINVHWSRLKRHKIGTENLNENSPSQILEISSPYVFHQSATNKVFLFYIYESCLLCKVIDDDLFTTSSRNRDSLGMVNVKKTIEQDTLAHFIDGSLVSADLKEEIQGYVNTEINERIGIGNIVFKYSFLWENFKEDRVLLPQRICAVDLPNGVVRVFYKHSTSTFLKSAIWNGNFWMAEDFLKSADNVDNLIIPDASGVPEVIGGFGTNAF